MEVMGREIERLKFTPFWPDTRESRTAAHGARPSTRQSRDHAVDCFNLAIDLVADSAPHAHGDVRIEFGVLESQGGADSEGSGHDELQAPGWRQLFLSDATSISFGSCPLLGGPPAESLA